MHRKLHVIYVPGLGDSRTAGQQLAVNTWRWWGVEPELLAMDWADGQPWPSKLQRLLDRIDTVSGQGRPVALVGASAGAAAVINAYAARPDTIAGCVIIAGKVNRPGSIGSYYVSREPAFVAAVKACQAALAALDSGQRRRILSLYGLADETVYRSDSHIPGARNRFVPTVGHAVNIGVQITLGAPLFLGFLKRCVRKS